MASSYPGALDSLTNPVGTDALTSPAHASQHANANDAIEAIEATLGINPQGAYATVKDRLAVVDLAAGSAAASASAAAVSATSAAGAAVDAGAAANSAVTALDNFDDRYLGAKSSAPTVDNDGNALLTGALYWNSTSSQMFAYTGTAWTTLANVAQAIEANSSSAALRITQTGAGNALLVEDSANPDATPFVVNATGQVLIGDDTARTVSGVSNQGLQVSGGGAGRINVVRYDNNATAGGIFVAKSRSSTPGSFASVQSGDSAGVIRFLADDGASLNSQVALIEAVVDGTPGTNDMPGRLVFSTTADGTGTATERMRINNAGNVGIGTSSPSDTLTVAGNITQFRDTSTNQKLMSAGATFNRIWMRRSAGTNAAPTIVSDGNTIGDILFGGYDGSAYQQMVSIAADVDGTPGAGDMPGRLRFLITPDGSATLAERMRIDNAGLITGTGTSLGAWTAWPSTAVGGGLTTTSGTEVARYMRIGKTVHFSYSFTFGASSAVTGDVWLALPINILANFRGNASGLFWDASASVAYPIVPVYYGSNALYLRASRANGTYTDSVASSATIPFTWTTSDQIEVSGTYEIA